MRWAFAKDQWTCGICRRSQRDFYKKHCPGIEVIDECPSKDESTRVPKLAESNQGWWRLFRRMQPFLWDGFGGVRIEAVREVMTEFHVPTGQRPIIFDKCLVAIAAIRDVRHQDREG